MSAVIVWFRRDFRLGDHPALSAALDRGQPIIPVFICDEVVETLGAAPKWRLEQAIAHFDDTLKHNYDSRLILRRGPARSVLQDLIGQTGATAVYWSRCYDPASIARDKDIKRALKAQEIDAQSFDGELLFEPWQPKTGAGEGFKVFTPFWRHVSQQYDAPKPLPQIPRLPPPDEWPNSDTLHDWNLGHAMMGGAKIVQDHAIIGENHAQERLNQFLYEPVAHYKQNRDFPYLDACSNLSQCLALGEISPRQIHWRAQNSNSNAQSDAGPFLRQLIWREFAYHLMWHFPHLDHKCWREDWEGFGWHKDETQLHLWQYGCTGVDFVDAGMREIYTTGRMHNRLRMIVGSYLCKHLLIDWRLGLDWFANTLIDWDPANNAMGWQWIAGCGPDASPYFRVFNPELQAEKFDTERLYRNHWLTGAGAEQFIAALPRSKRDLCLNRPTSPTQALDIGRQRALNAYHAFKSADNTQQSQ